MPDPNPTSELAAPHGWIEERTIAELQGWLTTGERTAEELAAAYVERIEAIDGRLGSIIEVNPDWRQLARVSDEERSRSEPRGPLHGIPIVVKDNIDTDDAMRTTAGSLALLGSRPAEDATVVARLRAAGALILGKANLSEWANFRGTASTSGWSARGGQTRNPYALDRSPLGSSSGSGAAVAANLAAAALGTETDGSIVLPASVTGTVGLKPTVGLTSRAGVIPIAFSQDTVGPMTRTVADAAVVLAAIAGADPRDPGTADAPAGIDYAAPLDGDGLAGARIGVARELWTMRPELVELFDRGLEVLRRAGAEVVDPVSLETPAELKVLERTVLTAEFRAAIADYLATRIGESKRTIDDLIAFNRDNAAVELAVFGQEIFEIAAAAPAIEDTAYLDARSTGLALASTAIDGVIDEHGLDAVVAPTSTPAILSDLVIGDPSTTSTCGLSAVAGYPILTLPLGAFRGLPFGLSFLGTAWSEPALLRLAAGFEARRGPRPRPALLDTIGP